VFLVCKSINHLDFSTVAEDNLINQKLLKKQLMKLGYESDVVGNGYEAIEKLKTGQQYTAFLCDCNMPECDVSEMGYPWLLRMTGC
jgi:CheY-like chemotaxis protein